MGAVKRKKACDAPERNERMKLKIAIGNSTSGYTHACVKRASTGRYTLVHGSVEGTKSLAHAAVRGLNEDEACPCAVTGVGDSLPVKVEN